MGDLMKAIEYLGIPTTIAIGLVGLFLIMQIIGEIIECAGKIVPEIFKIRKYFKRKKEEKERYVKMLEDMQTELKEIKTNVKESLGEMQDHYSPEKLKQRDSWMQWVNNRAEVYDDALNDLRSMKDTLLSNNELTLDLYINVNRNRIIDFASKVANENVIMSREEFNRIFKVYNEYEEILKQHNKTNGEVDIAYRIIKEAYEGHMKNHSFLEDIRGYNN